jgi:hypothetical protein
MNQAQQKALIQETNMSLINIRSIELNYFSAFFSSFGTQCALMIGFIVGSLSQVPGLENPPGCWYGFIVLYWVSSAITLAAGVHGLVCSVFVQVFGQGLGLRGPLGSMVRAVEGMVEEQENIVQTFIIAVFSFGFQCIGMYFIMMDWVSATVTSVITLLGIILWYNYSLRLYNRFSWKDMNIKWSNSDEGEQSDMDDDDSNPVKNAMHYRKKRLSKTKRGSSRSEEEDQALDELGSERGQSETPGGYLTLKVPGTFGDPWQRRYFMVRGKMVYYYKDKRAFQLDPRKPLNTRPIDLEGYTLIAGAREPPYSIALVPVDEDDNRKAWKFRCDTLAEFQMWLEIFSAGLKVADATGEQGNLVNIAPEGEKNEGNE